MHRLALVQQHVVLGAAFHRLAELMRAALKLGNELLVVRIENEIGEDADDHYGNGADGGDEFVTNFSLHNLVSPLEKQPG